MSLLTDQLTAFGVEHKGKDLGATIQWAILHIQSQHDAQQEIEEEAARLREENHQLRTAMNCFSELMCEVSKHLQGSAYLPDADVFARDFAPWRNLMQANGLKQDGIPIKPKRARAPKEQTP